MTIKEATPARNFLVLFLSQGVGKFVGLLFGFVAARWLGSAGFGNHALLSPFLSYFMVLADFGLSPLLVREMSQKPAARYHVLVSGLGLRLSLAAISFVAMIAIAGLLHWPPLFLKCLLVGGLGTFLYAWNSTLTDFLTSQEKLRFAATLDMVCQAVFLTLVITLLWRETSIVSIFIALVAANALRAIVLWRLAGKEIGEIRWHTRDIGPAKHMLGEVFTFALLGLMGTMYFKIDILLLYAFKPSAVVGWYEGAYRFLEALMVLNVSMMTALFPALSRMGDNPKQSQQLHETYVRATRFLLVSGLACAATVSWLAGPLIRLCYGADFSHAAPLVPVLMLALVLIHLNAPLGRILIALGRQRQVVKLSFITVGANIVLNLLFIPRWGAYGAAITTALSEILSFAIFYPLVSALAGPLPWKTLLTGFDQTDLQILRKAFARNSP